MASASPHNCSSHVRSGAAISATTAEPKKARMTAWGCSADRRSEASNTRTALTTGSSASTARIAVTFSYFPA